MAVALKNERIPVWLDRWELGPGDSLVDKIGAGLLASDYLILFLSTASLKSKWVKKEMNAALVSEIESQGATVIVALMRGTKRSDVPILLRDKIWVDFRVDDQIGFVDILEVFKRKKRASDLLLVRGIEWFNRGLAERALPLLERALELYPNNFTASYMLAAVYEAVGSPKDRGSLLRAACRGDPENALFRTGLAMYLAKEGHREDALQEVRTAQALAGDEPLVDLGTGNVLRAFGEWQAAIEAYERFFSSHLGDVPDLAQAIGLAGFAESLDAVGDTKRAIDVYERIRGWRHLPEILIARAELISKLDRAGDAALRAWELARSAAPDNPRPHEALAPLWFERGQIALALSAARAVVMLAPGNAAARVNLARLYEAAGRPSEAIAEIYKARELEPTAKNIRDEIDGLLSRASITRTAEDHSSSASVASSRVSRSSVEESQELAALHVLQSRAEAVWLKSKGKIARPLQFVRQLEKFVTGSPEGEFERLQTLGLWYLRLGKATDAIRVCRQVVGLTPELPAAHSNLATAYEYAGEYSLAVEELDLATILDPTDCELEFRLMMGLGRAELWDQLRARLERFVTRCEDSSHIAEAKELLASFTREEAAVTLEDEAVG